MRDPEHRRVIADNEKAMRDAREELRRARPIIEEAKRVERVLATQRRRRDDE